VKAIAKTPAPNQALEPAIDRLDALVLRPGRGEVNPQDPAAVDAAGRQDLDHIRLKITDLTAEKANEQVADDPKRARTARLATLRFDLQVASKADGVDKAEVEALNKLVATARTQIKDGSDEADGTMRRLEDRIASLMAFPQGDAARRAKDLQQLYKNWTKLQHTTCAEVRALAARLRDWRPAADAADAEHKRDQICTAIEQYVTTCIETGAELATSIRTVWDDGTPDAARRKAREAALAALADRQRLLRSHPLTKELLTSSLAQGKLLSELIAGLPKLEYAVLTAVPARTA
jgi:hypothetical protein